ncbi:MAG: GNAT family N-acetyltransferase [Herpetosiphonaceae bacterium]|nr:GNAT family N-acetyltransferase [Herpetosiphonaceae bacterium]
MIDLNRLSIEQWDATHLRWPELVHYIQHEDLAVGVIEDERPVPDARYLVVPTASEIAGFLMLIIQPIGPEMDCPILQSSAGIPLLEAKIRAFHVREGYRNHGIGTALQQAVLQTAARCGCYQVRSWSASTRASNYAIKVKLGFAAHPSPRTIRGVVVPGIYWIKRVDGGC